MHLTVPRRRLLLVAGAVLAATGCGPGHTISLGVKDVSTDIVLTQQSPAVTTDQPPPASLPPGFPFVPPAPDGSATGGGHVPLPPTDQPPPAPRPDECPSASALAGALFAAPSTPDAAPAPRTYPVRVSGGYTVKGPDAARGAYPVADTRHIHDVGKTPDGSGWTYQITDGAGLTTSYEVLPKQIGQDVQPLNQPEQSQPTSPGIYVTQFSYKRADGSRLTLNPQPALLVANLPLQSGDKWISRSVDPTTGVAIVLNGQTGLGPTYHPSHARVDACGTVLDAWWVSYTVNTMPVNDATKGQEPPSQLTGGGLDITFVGSRVAFGTQFGGIPVEESYVLKGTDGANTVSINRHSIYDVTPVHVGSTL